MRFLEEDGEDGRDFIEVLCGQKTEEAGGREGKTGGIMGEGIPVL